MEDKKTEFLLNILFIFGTFVILKCKCIKTQPFLVFFFYENTTANN